ncbi:MAG: hypothetical protein WD988_00120 [Candidatus Curtissbacteria bacterium]
MFTPKAIWKKWLSIAHVIGNFQAQVILTVFYFIFAAPFGFISRFFGDSLDMKPKRLRSSFGKWNHPVDSLESARKQF